AESGLASAICCSCQGLVVAAERHICGIAKFVRRRSHKVRWEGPRVLPRTRSVDAPCTTLGSLKRATGGPPPPLSRGRMSLIVLAARFCARAVARQSFDLVTAGLDPAVHAEVSRRHTSGKM